MKKINANTDATHQIKESEKHLYHVKLTNRENNPATKEYENKISIQKFRVKDFQQMVTTKFLSQNFYKVEILHNPELKEVKKVEDKKEAATTKEKPLSKAKLKELLIDLQIQYKKKFNEDADPDATIEDLKELLA